MSKHHTLSAHDTRLHLVSLLQYNAPCRFVKFGDAEYMCMAGRDGQGCDGQAYSPYLASDLNRVFRGCVEDYEGTFVAEWGEEAPFGELQKQATNLHGHPNWVSFETLLLQNDGSTRDVAKFWRRVVDTGRPLFYVGPESNRPVSKMLGAYHIVTPPSGAYEERELIKDDLNCAMAGTRLPIVIASGGPFSKVLSEDYRDFLDVGSGLDVLAGRSTRALQPDYDEVIREFSDFFDL